MQKIMLTVHDLLCTSKIADDELFPKPLPSLACNCTNKISIGNKPQSQSNILL